ncbi:RNA-binding S4 domain-containing protein [Schaalia sp. Marseille-Q2122]|uniref:RNA-binding S4 domain-containing protein n=1 Tax=Schaalia sp. Marseille-Q2122 TaxID=2736604 RepID=UPI00158EEB6B|nr:RNA-binding S4 domain-containing protein [Schaalia sp. Marseille-Q2122]
MTLPTFSVSGTIRLGQFLKLAGLVEDGVMARELITDGDVSVNGEVELRRGRKLADGDIVEVDSPAGRFSAQVATQPAPSGAN